MRFIKIIFFFLVISSLGFGFYWHQNKPAKFTNANLLAYIKAIPIPTLEKETLVLVDTANYTAVIHHFDNKRKAWTANIASDSLAYLIGDSLAPYWIGTPWDFNGISKQPQKGNIACGYFVYGLLEDAGFSLPRIKLSQATSENSIKALIGENYIKRYSMKDIDTFIADIINWGDGIYLVGLDYHIGMLQVKGEEIEMIHSSVYPPVAVVIEDGNTSAALTHSDYRIVGKLDNPDTIKKWLNGSYFSL